MLLDSLRELAPFWGAAGPAPAESGVAETRKAEPETAAPWIEDLAALGWLEAHAFEAVARDVALEQDFRRCKSRALGAGAFRLADHERRGARLAVRRVGIGYLLVTEHRAITVRDRVRRVDTPGRYDAEMLRFGDAKRGAIPALDGDRDVVTEPRVMDARTGRRALVADCRPNVLGAARQDGYGAEDKYRDRPNVSPSHASHRDLSRAGKQS